MKKFTALYIRTSTDKQDNGAESQKRALIDYCKSNGIKDYKIYEDKGISGAKSSRPKLDEVMFLVRHRHVTSVIVYSFSRFARSTKHLLLALETFRENHVDFVSLTEKVDTTSPMGRAFFTIIAAISQLERELIAERVKSGLENAKAKGKKLGKPKTVNSELIRKLNKEGYAQKDIADLVGCSRATVSRELKKSD